ncbi:MAG: hypothetical protein GPJ54_10215 [Candidatus Heimdallarchaeota archaeon]|nr:hypothetical protein [Candidatus Heimdallarchaeota archaeon]
MNRLSKSLRTRRGLSPVIATVLIIAVTVSAAAVVWVIVNNQLDDDLPTFTYEVQNSLDFNNDNKIDLLELKVRNIGSKAVNTTYVSDDAWVVIPGFDILLNSNEEAIIKIGTNTLSAQFEAKEKVRIGVGPFEDKFKIATIEIGNPVVPLPTRVTVNSGGTSGGLSITFLDDEGLPAPIPPLTTDNNGIVEAYLLPNYYVAKTSSSQQSEQFHNVLTRNVDINSNAETINVAVIDDQNIAVSGIVVFDADSNQNDLGSTQTTDINGKVSFSKADGAYLFRVKYLGVDYWSSQVSVPNASNVTIKLETNARLIGKLQFGGVDAGSGKRLRLYTSTNASMGRSDRTNTTSYFEFTRGVVPGIYRLRLDFQGSFYWSELVSTSDPNLVVDFGGGDLNIIVTAGDDPLPNRIRTRLFHATNVSAGRSDRLNNSGIATYPNTPGGNYILRVDWLGRRYFSDVFTHTDSNLFEINLGGGKLNVHITAGGEDLPNNVRTRLYHSNNQSASRSDRVNSTGWAEYGTIPDGDYLLRIDWLGQRFYTSVFTFDGSSVNIPLDGGSLEVLVLAGGVPLPGGVRVRLYNPDFASASRSDYLNGSGWAEFGSIIAQNYRLRIDWLGNTTFSDIFTHDGTPKNVTLPGGAFAIKVTIGGDLLPTNTLTRLRNTDSSSTGRTDRTNTTGWAEYGAIIGGDYRLRIDMLGKQYVTSIFTFDGSSAIQIDLAGGTLKVQVFVGGEKLPYNVRTRLYNDLNNSAGRSDRVNLTAWAEYNAIPDGNYILRIDWLGRKYYSSQFSFDGTPASIDLNGGNLTILVKMDGVVMPINARIRLQNHFNSSTYVNVNLNNTGYANFNAIPEGTYSIRLKWMARTYYSTEVYHDGSSNFTIDFAGLATSTITVEDNGSQMASNQKIRLYHADGTYTGFSKRTDINGEVKFDFLPTGEYMLEYNGRFSNAFNPTAIATIDILP